MFCTFNNSLNATIKWAFWLTRPANLQDKLLRILICFSEKKKWMIGWRRYLMLFECSPRINSFEILLGSFIDKFITGDTYVHTSNRQHTQFHKEASAWISIFSWFSSRERAVMCRSRLYIVPVWVTESHPESSGCQWCQTPFALTAVEAETNQILCEVRAEAKYFIYFKQSLKYRSWNWRNIWALSIKNKHSTTR